MAKQFKPETLCVQAGWTPKKGEYAHCHRLLFPYVLAGVCTRGSRHGAGRYVKRESGKPTNE